MAILEFLVKEDLLESMGLQVQLVSLALVDPLDLLENPVHLENLDHQVLQVFLVMVVDQVNLERKDHLALLDLKVDLDYQAHLDFLDFLVKEVYLVCLACLALREKWAQLAHLDLRVTRELKVLLE